MADLSILSQQAPFAGAWTNLQTQGIQNQQTAAETQRLQALIQQLQQQTQQQGQMNPLLLDQQRLQNQGLQAGLPGITADSDLRTTKASRAKATAQSDIDTDITKNSGESAKARAEAATAGGTILTAAGLQAKNAQGPGGQAIAVDKYLRENGIDENHGMYQFAMKHATEPDVLVNYGKSLIQSSAPYMQATDVENTRAQASKDVEKMRAQAMRDVAAMNIEAGKFDKNKVASDLDGQVNQQVLAAKGDSFKLYGIYTNAAMLAQSSQKPDLALKYAQQAAANKDAAQAQLNSHRPPTPDISQMGIPTTPGIKLGADPTPLGGGNPLESSASGVPPGAISMLKQHPELAAQFDAKYGTGAANKILKGQ